MKRPKQPCRVYLSEAVIRSVWAANHYGREHGTDGTVILLGRRTKQHITVLSGITEADSPAARQAKVRAARKAHLRVVGQSRAVTEDLLRPTTKAINNEHAKTFITPPVGHIFLLRHQLGPRSNFIASSFDGVAARRHDVYHLASLHKR